MKKYILKSAKSNAEVTLGFDHNDDLVFYQNETPDEAAVKWMNRFLPIDKRDLQLFVDKTSAIVTEIPEDLTFERFWIAYDKKINRKRTEPIYNKLDDRDKMQATIKIKQYQEYCHFKHRGIADPEKYLRERYFETDWSKLK